MSVREEVEKLLKKYSFTGALELFDIRLEIDEGAHLTRKKPVRCVLKMRLPDARGPGTFEAENAFYVDLQDPDEANHLRILNAILDRLLHEVAESVEFQGAKPLDPHTLNTKPAYRAWYSNKNRGEDE